MSYLYKHIDLHIRNIACVVKVVFSVKRLGATSFSTMSDELSNCPVGLDTLGDKPLFDELLKHLNILDNKWEKFALHLPGVTVSLLERIKNTPIKPDQSIAFFQRKLFCEVWIELYCHDVSWRCLLIAMNEVHEEELFLRILNNVIITKAQMTK